MKEKIWGKNGIKQNGFQSWTFLMVLIKMVKKKRVKVSQKSNQKLDQTIKDKKKKNTSKWIKEKNKQYEEDQNGKDIKIKCFDRILKYN